jgi:hypothetical protein
MERDCVVVPSSRHREAALDILAERQEVAAAAAANPIAREDGRDTRLLLRKEDP